MKSRIIYGKSRRSNTARCLEEINLFLKKGNGENLVILVPEQYSSFYEHLLVENSMEQGSFQAEVLTFKRLAYRLFGKIPGKREKYIDNAGKCMVMYNVIDEVGESLQAFSKPAAYPAFATEAVKTIKEFKRYGIDPEQLKEFDSGSTSDLLAAKLNELSLLFEKYEEKIHSGGYSDADDDLIVLAEAIRKSEEAVNARYWVDGFDGFTPAEHMVLEALIEKSLSVTTILCSDSLSQNSASDIFSPVVKTAKNLIKTGEMLGIGTLEHNVQGEDPYTSGIPGELEYLARKYFDYEAPSSDISCEAIRIFEAETIYEEVEKCAVEIATKVRNGEMKYGDISVISGLYDEYKEYIDVIFSKYGIPVFLDEKRDMAKHPVISFILSLLDVYIEKFSYDSTFTFLKSPYCKIGPSEVFELENYVLEWEIKGMGMWTEGDWEFHKNRDASDRLKKINEIRKKVNEMTQTLFSKFKYGLTAGEFVKELFNYLTENDIYRKIIEDAEKAREDKRLDYADELTQSWNILMDVFDQLNTVSGEKRQTVEKFRTYLEIAISQKKIGIIPPRTDMVFAGGVDKAAGNNISMLMILGANDPGFPVSPISEGLLTDRDRKDAQTAGIELAEDTRTRTLNGRMDVYNILNLPQKNLYASYSRSSSDGSARRRSGFIDRILSLFDNLDEPDGDKIEPEDLILTPLTGMEEYYRKANRNTALHKWYMENGLPVLSIEKKDSAEDIMFSAIARGLYGEMIESSPTAIETYAECPYKYFATYSLRASERPIYEISPPDVGSILHEILKSLVSEHGGEKDPDYARCHETAKRTFAGMELSKVFSRTKRKTHLGERVVKRAVDSFMILKKQIDVGQFKPIEFEASFGINKPIKALDFDAGEAKIYLNGRIDRVDGAIVKDEEYFRIIDYKSSSRKLKLFKVKEGLDIQLPAYMMAYGNHSGTKPAGMYYFAAEDRHVKADYGITEEEIDEMAVKNGRMDGYTLKDREVIEAMDSGFTKKSVIIPATADKDGELKKYVISEEDMEGIFNTVADLVVNKTKAIYEGKYQVYPVYMKSYNACTYCPYRGICGFNEEMPHCKYNYIDEKDDKDIEWGGNG